MSVPIDASTGTRIHNHNIHHYRHCRLLHTHNPHISEWKKGSCDDCEDTLAVKLLFRLLCPFHYFVIYYRNESAQTPNDNSESLANKEHYMNIVSGKSSARILTSINIVMTLYLTPFIPYQSWKWYCLINNVIAFFSVTTEICSFCALYNCLYAQNNNQFQAKRGFNVTLYQNIYFIIIHNGVDTKSSTCIIGKSWPVSKLKKTAENFIFPLFLFIHLDRSHPFWKPDRFKTRRHCS